MDVIDLSAPEYHVECFASFLGVPWDHFGDHWIPFSTPGALEYEPRLSRRPFGLPMCLVENSGQVLEDVASDFTVVVRF